jgi:Glucose-6-phosphate dehydrogenase, C-terminal domain
MGLPLHPTGGAPESPVPQRRGHPRAICPPTAACCSTILRGGSTFAVRDDEAEYAWRVVTPVLEAWREDVVTLEEYRAGSAGRRSRSS